MLASAPMGNPLWAPWRMDYILAPKEKECIFCGVDRASEDERRQRLVVCTTPRAYVMLNRFPFAAGHLLVVPYDHTDSLELLDEEDSLIAIPATHRLLMPVVISLPLQLLSYYIAVRRGCDVDQPRNLAKSVTVE